MYFTYPLYETVAGKTCTFWFDIFSKINDTYKRYFELHLTLQYNAEQVILTCYLSNIISIFDQFYIV